jgi:hypothetical protein
MMRGLLCNLGRWLLVRLRNSVRRCEERPTPQYRSLIQFHARTILLMACRARNRTIKSYADRTAAGEVGVLTDDAITAIVMAAAAAEAFINELADNIGLVRQNASDWMPLEPTVRAASDAILDVEFYRGSLVEKYLEAAKALKNRFDKGNLPFQDFERLIALRNAIMHVKPVRSNERHSGEAVTDELARRGIGMAATTGQLPWFDRLMAPEVARWACQSARTVILDLFSKIPVGAPDAFDMERRLYGNDALFESESFV